MKTINLAIAVAVLAAPIAIFSVPAIAATANNAQTGAHTSNAHDTKASAMRKQMRMHRRMRRRMK